MSIKIEIITYRKKELAELLDACSNLITASSNDTVTLHYDLTFNTKEKKT